MKPQKRMPTPNVRLLGETNGPGRLVRNQSTPYAQHPPNTQPLGAPFPKQVVPQEQELIDKGYYRRDNAFDGIGFGTPKGTSRNDVWLGPKSGVPLKYDVTQLTQRYPLYKEAAGLDDDHDVYHYRRVV